MSSEGRSMGPRPHLEPAPADAYDTTAAMEPKAPLSAGSPHAQGLDPDPAAPNETHPTTYDPANFTFQQSAAAKRRRASGGAREIHGEVLDEVQRKVSRRKTGEGFVWNPIGCVLLRVQDRSAPGPLLYFDHHVNKPVWLRETIDGLQPLPHREDFDMNTLKLDALGKLVGGQVLATTLDEVTTYYTHIFNTHTLPYDPPHQVVMAIQCNNAKGWFTYKRTTDNMLTPIVLCAAVDGNGLEEVSPAHFEVHRAQCSQKKWRHSFKVLGAYKVHKVSTLAPASLQSTISCFQELFGPNAPSLDHLLQRHPSDCTTVAYSSQPSAPPLSTGAVTERGSDGRNAAAQEADAEGPMGQGATSAPAVEDLTVQLLQGAAGSKRGTLAAIEGLAQLAAAGQAAGTVRRAASSVIVQRPTTLLAAPAEQVWPSSGDVVAPAQPALPPLPPLAPGSRIAIGGRPVLRRTTDFFATSQPAPATEQHRLHAQIAEEDLPVQPTPAPQLPPSLMVPQLNPDRERGAEAALMTTALSGYTLNGLLQLVVDNTARKAQRTQQAALLEQLAALQTQAHVQDTQQMVAAVQQLAGDMAAATPGTVQAGPGAAEGKFVPSVLSAAECDALRVVVGSVHGPDLAHAVRGALQHVALQYSGLRVHNPMSRDEEQAAAVESPTCPPEIAPAGMAAEPAPTADEKEAGRLAAQNGMPEDVHGARGDEADATAGAQGSGQVQQGGEQQPAGAANVGTQAT